MKWTIAAHIVAGSIGLISGFIALYATKGASVHRRVGMVFVCAMLSMSVLGMFMAAAWGRAPAVNVPAALLTSYLIITSLATVRPPRVGSQSLLVGGMIVVFAVSLADLVFGAQAVANGGSRHGIPAFPFFMFGIVGLLATAGDLRVARAGVLRGGPRIARHLWRMSFALFIAAMSFFIGQAKVIPKPIRILPLLAVPPLIVLIAMFYWMWKIRTKRAPNLIAVFSSKTTMSSGEPHGTASGLSA